MALFCFLLVSIQHLVHECWFRWPTRNDIQLQAWFKTEILKDNFLKEKINRYHHNMSWLEDISSSISQSWNLYLVICNHFFGLRCLEKSPEKYKQEHTQNFAYNFRLLKEPKKCARDPLSVYGSQVKKPLLQ